VGKINGGVGKKEEVKVVGLDGGMEGLGEEEELYPFVI